ncbi:MAG: hypothetical protein PHY83_00080 [Bacilli bacterium]|nr:hypothetical protein [Bacilli bacterium]MDD3098983.1 hypothetical protein [Bacilli bacterium]
MNKDQNVCIICDQFCDYTIIDTLVDIKKFLKIYCLFTNVDSNLMQVYRKFCVAVSIDKFKKIFKDLDIIIIDPNIKCDISNLIEVANKNDIQLIDLRDYEQYIKKVKKQDFSVRYKSEKASVLLIDVINTNHILKFAVDFKKILSNDYVTSYISNKKLSQIFDLVYVNPLDYEKLELNNVELRNFFSNIIKNIVDNTDISLIDLTYPVINYNDFFDEQKSILVKDYVVSLKPDYVICILPINRLKIEDQEIIVNKVENDLNISVDCLMAIDYCFDEFTYASKNEIVMLESTEYTKNKISVKILDNLLNYRPIYRSWINSDIELIKNEIENKLGKDILFEII